LSPKARQISLTVCRLIPRRWAIDRVDPCVASLGVEASVRALVKLEQVLPPMGALAWRGSR
jgi:hypothetical protein